MTVVTFILFIWGYAGRLLSPAGSRESHQYPFFRRQARSASSQPRGLLRIVYRAYAPELPREGLKIQNLNFFNSNLKLSGKKTRTLRGSTEADSRIFKGILSRQPFREKDNPLTQNWLILSIYAAII